MYHTRVDKFRASYVALVINIKTSLFTPSTFFDANFEQMYHPNVLGLRLECVGGKVFPYGHRVQITFPPLNTPNHAF